MVTMAAILEAAVDDITELSAAIELAGALLGGAMLLAMLDALLITELEDIAEGLESPPPQALKIKPAARGINRLGNCFMGYSLLYSDNDAGYGVQPALT